MHTSIFYLSGEGVVDFVGGACEDMTLSLVVGGEGVVEPEERFPPDSPLGLDKFSNTLGKGIV